LKLGNGSLEPTIPKISDDFRAVITSMNAADKSVQFQLLVSPPLYPVQIFYKPMTGLVWLGTGIFTLGGLLSAFYRRSKKMSAEGDFTPKTATI
jgi:cytochrome c-type biogenesis protein CcmF